jgi:integrase
MPVADITVKFVKSLPPPPDGKDKERYFDSRLTGFVAERRRNCVTFYFRYNDERGRARDVKLGRFGDVTVDAARKRAEQLRAEVSLGGDPAATTDRRRAVPTLAELIHERYLPHAKERMRSWGNVDAYCRLRIVPRLGRKRLDEISQQDVADFRRWLIGEELSPSSVNRHLATVRSIYNLARKWGVYDGVNPAASPNMMQERGRDRYLTPEQTRALAAALDRDFNQTAAVALFVLMTTGARKQEILKARWEHVDLDRRMLTVPRSKSGRPRHIPLSPPVVAVLARQLRRRVDGHPFVFPGKNPGEPLENVRSTWERVRSAAGLDDDLRIHDLRHSFASVLANAGTPLNEIGVILGHSQLSTTQRYAHHAPERLVSTASVAARAWNLLPAADVVEDGDGRRR